MARLSRVVIPGMPRDAARSVPDRDDQGGRRGLGLRSGSESLVRPPGAQNVRAGLRGDFRDDHGGR
jgi:hypothetical protein